MFLLQLSLSLNSVCVFYVELIEEGTREWLVTEWVTINYRASVKSASPSQTRACR